MNTGLRMVLVAALLVVVTACGWEVGRFFSISNSTAAVVSNLILYHSQDPIMSVEVLNPGEQTAWVYWKLGVNVSFGLLPAVSAMILKYGRGGMSFEHEFEVPTRDAEGRTQITIVEEGIDLAHF